MLLLVINYILLHQFLSGLPASVSRQLRASGEANNLVKAIERARLLMSIDNETLPVAAVAPEPDLQLQQEKIERPTEQVAALSTQVANEQRKPKHCYNCGRTGHIQHECFYLDQHQYMLMQCQMLSMQPTWAYCQVLPEVSGK